MPSATSNGVSATRTQRQSKVLTQELQDQICSLVAAGNYVETASAFLGIRPQYYFDWCSRGRKDISDGNPETQYAVFLYAVKEAEARAEAESLLRVRSAAKGGEIISRKTVNKSDGSVEVFETFSRPEWTAAAWFLERKFPDKFGRRDRTIDSVRQNAESIAKELGIPIDEYLMEAQRVHEARKRGM